MAGGTSFTIQITIYSSLITAIIFHTLAVIIRIPQFYFPFIKVRLDSLSLLSFFLLNREIESSPFVLSSTYHLSIWLHIICQNMKSNIIFNQGDRLKNGSLENTHTHTHTFSYIKYNNCNHIHSRLSIKNVSMSRSFAVKKYSDSIQESHTLKAMEVHIWDLSYRL